MKEAPKIVLGVTGSIAAYKAAELTRLMVKEGWDVRVAMTDGAKRFIAPLTFLTLSRNPVAPAMFDEPGEWPPPHIGLATWADAFVVAPCTANVIAKIANGIADDTLTASALAFGQGARLVVAPAMNDAMLANPATQANISTLAARGVTIVEAAEGDLACGSTGRGRLADLADIISAIRRILP